MSRMAILFLMISVIPLVFIDLVMAEDLPTAQQEKYQICRQIADMYLIASEHRDDKKPVEVAIKNIKIAEKEIKWITEDTVIEIAEDCYNNPKYKNSRGSLFYEQLVAICSTGDNPYEGKTVDTRTFDGLLDYFALREKCEKTDISYESRDINGDGHPDYSLFNAKMCGSAGGSGDVFIYKNGLYCYAGYDSFNEFIRSKIIAPNLKCVYKETDITSSILITVDSAQIYKEYDENEVAADEKYKGQLLEVKGAISSIRKDFKGNAYLTLNTPNQFKEIHANLRADQVRKAVGFSKGQNVTVRGEGGGMFMGSIFINDCIAN